ncbi:hypothetical protein C4J81_11045 [Deltaproteobacteria bacterium Smac51]|nr:hypothetical protein C4J81_11045 [Deltaproteobacteria bacterium Smac51]
MKTYEHPEVQLLHRIKQVRANNPDVQELVDLEKEAREIVESNALNSLKKEAFNAILGKPELVGGDFGDKVYTFLRNILTYMELERSGKFDGPLESVECVKNETLKRF